MASFFIKVDGVHGKYMEIVLLPVATEHKTTTGNVIVLFLEMVDHFVLVTLQTPCRVINMDVLVSTNCLDIVMDVLASSSCLDIDMGVPVRTNCLDIYMDVLVSTNFLDIYMDTK